MLGRLRVWFTPLKDRVAEPLARAGVPPLAISLAGIPLSLLGGWLLLQGSIFWAVVWSTAASLTDFLDGAVARLQQRSSPLGNYLEAIIDKTIEMILLLALAHLYPLPAAFAMCASFLVSFAKPRVGLVVITDNRDWPGWADHADRIAWTIVAMATCALPWKAVPALMLWALAGFALVGAAQRLRYAVDLIAQAERDGTLLPYLRHTSERTPPPESRT